jgi:hypothetical protein
MSRAQRSEAAWRQELTEALAPNGGLTEALIEKFIDLYLEKFPDVTVHDIHTYIYRHTGVSVPLAFLSTTLSAAKRRIRR